MQSVGQDDNIALVTAEALREMTITKEALYDKQKASVLDSLMSSMVKLATESGAESYVANLNPQFDPKMLGDITEEFKKLGYKVSAEAKSQEKLGSFIQVVINW